MIILIIVIITINIYHYYYLKIPNLNGEHKINYLRLLVQRSIVMLGMKLRCSHRQSNDPFTKKERNYSLLNGAKSLIIYRNPSYKFKILLLMILRCATAQSILPIEDLKLDSLAH